MARDDQQGTTFLTFGQREGLEPLPRQLAKTEMTHRLRAKLWDAVSEFLDIYRIGDSYSGYYLGENGKYLIKKYYVDVRGVFSDTIPEDYDDVKLVIRTVIEKGTYVDVFNFIAFALGMYKQLPKPLERIDNILRSELSAYRVVGGNQLIAIGSQEEADVISKALNSSSQYGAQGARSHLRKAIASSNNGDYADSVHESISAVESLSKVLSQEPKTGLSKALAKLEKSANIHGGMKDGFMSLYGYTSDEKGIRHSLLFKDKADVDEVDALFMIGACSSFVSYLISRAIDAGISVNSPE